MKKLLLMLLALLPGVSALAAGYAESHSYDTLCAEMDNINIPLTSSNVTAYRVTATSPQYVPTSISEWGAVWTNCTFDSEPYIWLIGYDNSSAAEFLNDFTFDNGDIFYAQDVPAAGNNESVSLFPREINNDWMRDQYIQFTTDVDSDFNLEAAIGAVFTLDMSAVSGTLELQALAKTTNDWLDLGSKVFSPSQLTHTWDVPDHTWIEGVDSNSIHLRVLTNGTPGSSTTPGAWAHYDYLKLEKRPTDPELTVQLYAGSNTLVYVIQTDFWWLDPDFMTVQVIGGDTYTKASYLRIKQRQSDGGWNETFVLYQDGNARIIPLPPPSQGAIPYGASVILGTSTNSSRPFSVIDELIVDPEDLSIDVTYRDSTTAHIELRSDHVETVVDVTGVNYNTNLPFARYRSMWVMDGKSDVDRIRSADGYFPIMDDWSRLDGNWWEFNRETPSYHNTYCPDIRVDILGSAQRFLTREAENNESAVNATTTARSNASGGQAVFLSETAGGELLFDINLLEDRPDTSILIHYSDPDGATGDYPGNAITVGLDETLTNQSTTVCTGGWDEFETLPALFLGDLSAGPHQIKISSAAGSAGVEIDAWELMSQPARTWPSSNLVVRQCENYTWATNTSLTGRPTAVGNSSLHLEHTGSVMACVGYTFSAADVFSNVYLNVRFSDDVGPTRLLIYLDNELRIKVPTTSTGGWGVFDNTYRLYLGAITAGSHEIKFVSDNTTWGADLDEFSIYTLIDNSSPLLGPEVLPLFPVGSLSNFLVSVDDPDGQSVIVQNVSAPANSTFIANEFSWTAPASASGSSTNALVLVANDQQGLDNSIVTNVFYITVPEDYDGNGVDDGWEWIHFTQLGVTPTDDPDQDGADNLAESIAGTAPNDSASVFAVTMENTDLLSNNQITVPTQPAHRYTIYFSDTLAEDSWSTFGSSSAGSWLEGETTGNHTFIDDYSIDTSGAEPTAGKRYYRVKVEKP